jgi:hypothetical protein
MKRRRRRRRWRKNNYFSCLSPYFVERRQPKKLNV